MLPRRAILLMLLLLAAPARATVVLEVGLDDMSRTSDVIFHGVVTRTDVVAVGGDATRLVTDVTFSLTEVLKGRALVPEPSFTLRLIGGQRGGLELRIPGMPRFSEGDEVVMFLERTEGGFAITGLSQGRFEVRVDAETGERVVDRSLGSVGVARFGAGGEFEMTEAPASLVRYPLANLLDEVRHWIAEDGVAR
ncbi:MAG: hypothetical protein AMXMBFR64_29820 [Myxococcales bacterium]